MDNRTCLQDSTGQSILENHLNLSHNKSTYLNSNTHHRPEKTHTFTRVHFRPKEQSDIPSQSNINGSSTAPPAQGEQNESKGALKSSQTIRPQLKKLTTMSVEEGVIRGKYFETLDQSNGFAKKEGYFTEYLRQNKKLIDQYKVRKSPNSGHSRYISKPVFFTTLKSKNKLTENITSDHSEVLEITKLGSPQNSKSFFSPSDKLIRQESALVIGERSVTQSPNASPFAFQTKQTLERTKSQILPKHRVYTPTASPKKFHRDSPMSGFPRAGDSEGNFTKTFINFNTLSTITGTTSDLNMLDDDDKSKKLQTNKIQLENIRNNEDIKRLTKYHTRQLAQALANRCAERSKVEPEHYMEHRESADYLRQTSIAFTLKQRKSRASIGTPKIDRVNRIEKSYKEPSTLEEIGKFEEGIAGWVKSVPNFGKQRWTYDKSWEFRLI